jgi:long-chain acyl-CoA synthetase
VIVPAFTALEAWAAQNGVTYSSHAELVANPTVRALYEEIVAQVNENLARFERMKKVFVAPAELSIENGTLTPTLKLRRRNVEAMYKAQIDRMYAEAGAEVKAEAATERA